MSKVIVKGTLIKDFEFNHEFFGETFYESVIATKRISGTIDNIMVIISERILGDKKFKSGDRLSLSGNYRSRSIYKNGKKKKIMFLFAKEIEKTEEDDSDIAFLEGKICKKPVYRETPRGRRITDLLIEVERSSGKKDYINCICWNKNAKIARNLDIGTTLNIIGRVQSRIYKKRISESKQIESEISEVSITHMEVNNE